jgi:hypothetical protein
MAKTFSKKTLTAIRNSLFIRIILVIIAAGIIALTAISTYNLFKPDTNPIPKDIRSHLSFSPFIIPLNTKEYVSDNYRYSKAENNVDILSYVVHLNNAQITLSEYAQPSQFTDIPDYQNQFLANVIQQYDTVQTSNGQIYLGRLTNKSQLGIMIEKGLIVFMTPNHDLSTSTWHNIGENLVIYRAVN